MEVFVGLLVVAAIVFYLVSRKKKKSTVVKVDAKVEKTKPENAENIIVAGIKYRLEDVKTLGHLNANYNLSEAEIKKSFPNEAIYELVFPEYPARFEFEPDNEYDPNAIAIYANDVKIGYVKKGSTAHIKNLINNGAIEKLTCKIYGGSYKLYSSDIEDFEDVKAEPSAKVTIYKKK